MAQGTIAGRILSQLIGVLASGGAGGIGGIGGGIAGRILGGPGGRGPAPGTVYDYPNRQNTFTYDVDLVDVPQGGGPTFNQNYKAFPNPKYARMQTLDQHNRALNKYLRPGQSPMERRWAIEKGEQEERKLPEFWVDDTHARDPKSKASSSAVSDIKILPNGDISIRFRGKGKWYSYNGGPNPYEAALEAHDLFTSHSIGQNMNRKGDPGCWAARHAKW